MLKFKEWIMIVWKVICEILNENYNEHTFLVNEYGIFLYIYATIKTCLIEMTLLKMNFT